MIITIIRTIKGFLRAAYKPIKLILIPIVFLFEKLLILSCFNHTSKNRNNNNNNYELVVNTEEDYNMQSNKSQVFFIYNIDICMYL